MFVHRLYFFRKEEFDMYDKLFTQKFMEDNDIFFENLKQISEPNKKQKQQYYQ